MYEHQPLHAHCDESKAEDVESEEETLKWRLDVGV